MVHLLEQHRPEIVELCRRYGVLRLEVFGSAADGSFDDETSDFDFLVEFDYGDEIADAFDRYFGLKESLETLLGKPVDLVSARAVRNPCFRRSMDASRTPLYAA